MPCAGSLDVACSPVYRLLVGGSWPGECLGWSPGTCSNSDCRVPAPTPGSCAAVGTLWGGRNQLFWPCAFLRLRPPPPVLKDTLPAPQPVLCPLPSSPADILFSCVLRLHMLKHNRGTRRLPQPVPRERVQNLGLFHWGVGRWQAPRLPRLLPPFSSAGCSGQ